MALQMNKRHQLSLGIVIMIVVIAAVHLLIYRPQQRKLVQAHQSYLASAGQIRNLSLIRDNQQMWDEYIQSTKTYSDQFQSVKRDLNILRPAYYATESKENTQKQIEDFNQALENLLKYRDELEQNEDNRLKLTFLGPYGWDFPIAINEALTQNNSSQLIDRLDDLRDTFQILENMTIEEYKAQKIGDLYVQLGVLNINARKLWDMHYGRLNSTEGYQTFGRIIPTLKVLFHLSFLEKHALAYQQEDPNYTFNKQQYIDYFINNIPDSVAPLGYPEDSMQMYAYKRQLDALVDIMQRAVTHNVSEIREVYFKEFESIKNPTDDTKTVAELAPMRIVIVAENSNILELLWEMNHSSQLYEIDNITFRSERAGQATLVTADVLLGVLIYIYDVSDVTETTTVAAGTPAAGAATAAP